MGGGDMFNGIYVLCFSRDSDQLLCPKRRKREPNGEQMAGAEKRACQIQASPKCRLGTYAVRIGQDTCLLSQNVPQFCSPSHFQPDIRFSPLPPSCHSATVQPGVPPFLSHSNSLIQCSATRVSARHQDTITDGKRAEEGLQCTEMWSSW